MTAGARMRSGEATFTGWLLVVAGAALAVVTLGVDLLKETGWALGPVQKLGLGLGAAAILLGVAVLRLPMARTIAARTWPFGTAPPSPPAHVLGFAVWLAAASGVLEVGLRYIRFETGASWGTLNPHAVWMVPVLNGMTLVALALPLALFSFRRLPHLGSPRFAAFVLLLIAIGAPLSLFRTELRWISVILLTVGLAFQGSGWIAAHRSGTRAWVRRTAIPLAAVVALATIAPLARQEWSERNALAAMPDPPPRAPHVLLIVLDTVRAQNLSVYGYGRRTTPWLEELAQSSAVFDRAYAPSSWTLPSHGSFFTGRPPHQQSGDSFTPLDDALPTIAGALRDRGYYTVGIVANSDNAFPHTGLDRGFLRYDAGTAAFWEMVQSAQLGEPWKWGLKRLGVLLPTRKDADTVNERFLARLEDRGERPFFAFLNYYDAHFPFDEPLPPASSIEGWAEHPVEIVGQMNPGVSETVDDYDREIAYLDDRLRALFSALDRRALLDDTIVIVTSDHGEEFMEHGFVGHGFNLYHPTLHVPLIVSRPGQIPEGIRIRRPVGLQDLPATIMELAGFGDGAPFVGGGLLATASDTLGPAPVLSELTVASARDETPPPWNHRSLVWGDLHYIRTDGPTEELFDLGTDPWESRNLVVGGAHPRLEEFRAALAGLVGALDGPPGEP